MSIASEINRIQQNVTDSLSAVAAKGVVVPDGSNSDDLPELIAQITTGSGSAITVVDTEDTNGGIIRTITGVSLAGDTVTAAHLERGYTAHDALGNPITGTLSPSGGSISLQDKTGIVPTEASQTVTADAGYDGLSSVQIDAISSTYVGSNVPTQAAATITPTESEQTAVAANVYTTGAVKVGAISSTYVGSGVATQAAKTVTPTESEQNAVAANVYTTGIVKVGAISSDYVGSGITRRSSTDLSASGATVTVPAGYYAEQASKAVSTMTLPTSASSSATSGYTSKATIGRSTSDQYINIPTGYNAAGAYYKVSAIQNGSVTAPSSISGSSATISTGTNTLTLTKTVSVTPSVTTAGYISAGTAGNASVSLTASVTTKAAETITPTKSAQSIAAGTYLTGTQTIAAIPAAYQDVTGVTAAAGDVVSGKTIVDSTGATVNGSLVIQHYYTGSSAPSSSLGENGDIYLQTA